MARRSVPALLALLVAAHLPPLTAGGNGVFAQGSGVIVLHNTTLGYFGACSFVFDAQNRTAYAQGVGWSIARDLANSPTSIPQGISALVCTAYAGSTEIFTAASDQAVGGVVAFARSSRPLSTQPNGGCVEIHFTDGHAPERACQLIVATDGS